MRVAEFIYSPREQFIPFHQRTKRWACMVCHRRAGKTVAAVNDLIVGALECRLERPQFAYVAPFRNQAKLIAWEYLKHYARPFLADRPNESELSVQLAPALGGGRIMLFGADNPDALRGIYLDGVHMDEFGDFRPSVFGNVIRPTLSDRKGWAVFGGTPKGRNEFWQVREQARKAPDEWYLIELRADESEILDADEIAATRRQLTEEQFAQEYLCDFSAALIGAYYGRDMNQAEREGRLCEVAYDDAVPVYTAWDIGYRDDTAIWWFQVVRDEIHVIDFHAASGQPIQYYADLVNSKPYRYATHWLPHDARAKTLASGGKSVIEQLAAAIKGGLASLAIVPNLEVQDGIQAARVALRKTWFDEGACAEGIEALRAYQREFDEEKKVFRERPRHDWTSHAADAFRMLAVAWRAQEVEPVRDTTQRALIVGAVPPGFAQASLDDMWKVNERGMSRRARV